MKLHIRSQDERRFAPLVNRRQFIGRLGGLTAATTRSNPVRLRAGSIAEDAMAALRSAETGSC